MPITNPAQLLRQLTQFTYELDPDPELRQRRLQEEIDFLMENPPRYKEYFEIFKILVTRKKAAPLRIIIEPFQAAVWTNRVGLVKVMLEKVMSTTEGINALRQRFLKIDNRSGENLLHGLVRRIGNVEILQLLFNTLNELGINIVDYASIKTKAGHSLVHVAAESLNPVAVDYLIGVICVPYSVPTEGQNTEEILATDYGKALLNLYQNASSQNPFILKQIENLNVFRIGHCLSVFAHDIYAKDFFSDHNKVSPKIIKTLIQEILSMYYKKFLEQYGNSLNVEDLAETSEYSRAKKFCTKDLPDALLPVLEIDRKRRAVFTFGFKCTNSYKSAQALLSKFLADVSAIENQVLHSTEKSSAYTGVTAGM